VDSDLHSAAAGPIHYQRETMGEETSDNKVSRNAWPGEMTMKNILLFSLDRSRRLTQVGLFCQVLNQAVDADDNDGGVAEEDIIKVSETFQPHKNDGYALIQSVTTSNGKKLLHEMKVLMPEGSVTAILGPSGAGKSTLLNTLTNSLSINSTAVADSTWFNRQKSVLVGSLRLLPTPYTLFISFPQFIFLGFRPLSPKRIASMDSLLSNRI
jgi:hypothetical protein